MVISAYSFQIAVIVKTPEGGGTTTAVTPAIKVAKATTKLIVSAAYVASPTILTKLESP